MFSDTHGRNLLAVALFALFSIPVGAADAPTITQAQLDKATVKARALVEKELGFAFAPELKVRSAEIVEIEEIVVQELTARYVAEFNDAPSANRLAIEISRIWPRYLLGKYVAKTNEILIIRGNFKNMADRMQKPEFSSEEVLYAALLNEFVHAADEQRLLWNMKLDALHGPQAVSYSSVIDGHARDVTRRICEKNGWRCAARM